MATLDPSMHAIAPAGSSARDRAMVVHDLRCALQGVVGGVALLEAAGLEPALREQVERIAAASRCLGTLLGRFVGDGGDEGGGDGAEAVREPVDIAAFLAGMARRWSGEARERRVDFAIEREPDGPAALDVDLVSLERALGNLISNAMRHAGPGRVRVTLRAGPDGGLVVVVRDGGPGFARELVERMTGGPQEARPADGHGLGLQIVRRLCGEMGAAFTLDPRAPGGGVEARLAFPARLCVRAPAPAAPRRPCGEASLPGLRVLLAEDNPTNQMVATQMLAALGAEVELSADGVEALQRFEAGEYDLVIVDIEMPRMSGLDVIRAIRSRGDRRARVPIVALTAYAMREHRERIAAAGANGLISKPLVSLEAFGRALREHVAPGAAASPEAAAPEADVAGPVADVAIFDALCASIGMNMMAELLDKVVADLLQARADLLGAVEPVDRRTIRSASHILISVAGAIGATRLQGCARTLNASGHSGDVVELLSGLRRCVAEIDAAVDFARSRRPAG